MGIAASFKTFPSTQEGQVWSQLRPCMLLETQTRTQGLPVVHLYFCSSQPDTHKYFKRTGQILHCCSVQVLQLPRSLLVLDRFRDLYYIENN